MLGRWTLAIVGLILIVAGGLLAHFTQIAGGIRIEDVRFKGAKGNTMSALLYIPPNATPQIPAPGILAVHGYINSRETQDGFAIEFARRGYVVLALDQTGHGYSDPPSFANGFGGPDGLAYLRSLQFVDKENIGLEGHSMGGWTVLAAAAAMPNDYKSMVLEGSSTGKPFAAEGTANWPRNTALVFAQYEEFPDLMWGVQLARDVTKSPKLWALFGTQGAVEPGKVYGDPANGTARVLYTPAMTHPAEHISHEAIGYSLDWFAKTLKGGTSRPVDDQIWFRKEIGTLIALIGFIALVIGTFDGLLEARMFSRLRLPAVADGTMPPHQAASGRRWTTAFILSAFIPALTYYPAFALGGTFVTPSAFLPQGITNQILVWAIINGLITLALMRFAPKRTSRTGLVGQSVVIALASVAVGYAALWLADLAFKIDFRFWIVALKLMSAKQFLIFLIYLIPFTAFFVVALHVLHRNFSTMDAPRGALYLTNILALTFGFIVLLVLQYGTLWLTGKLFNPVPDPGFVPLSTIVAIQFVPLLAIVAVIATFTWRRTGSSLPGALIAGLFVTWYIVAGTATQVPF
ncbi:MULTISPECIES: alpha/beta hydrolase family protein [Bradyrhizobium]|jgi:pimeloyl-ACP methyl ester carboxylesterase|uniref:alpha/beta hydrolase family protein n=1 Tax=Bradyrhizobium TaxID=374 RepID=UPI002169663F|nr:MULTISPECIES: alpha/beta hydrolase [Bradyrhizobium]MCS3450788.1 pimeloyl-ACP methyl ester carboxylesterase [Bradyrhizobium elkanii]MCS3558067.1 pimeloyl-ACP methyl ester carboxylesterase [Bradyrhizobium elkanii]MCW2152086.1 pimeloyl-ACP methyl ester carboxylesterase [Bradyrhizobium elkanii]MCW2358038.1 pimeloyl-ACP methyl ester carboxylesterase [Bradyrhizobium elkanii]MCW2375817.1 pimeloyl-ACP methyl ester carboxylesterase [Bradyrhizobium elkanii]